MMRCPLCGGETRTHCPPGCNRGWRRCDDCGGYGEPGGKFFRKQPGHHPELVDWPVV